jgi:hypothetical protein
VPWRVGSSCLRTIWTFPVSSFATTVASKPCDDETWRQAASIAAYSARASSTLS